MKNILTQKKKSRYKSTLKWSTLKINFVISLLGKINGKEIYLEKKFHECIKYTLLKNIRDILIRVDTCKYLKNIYFINF